MVKELREKSGAGMMDAKKALLETDGNLEAAEDWLRTKGLLKAEKKSSRIAAEGLVGVKVHDNQGMIVELNSETDFVATNKEFIELVDLILKEGFGVNEKDDVLDKSVSGKTIQDHINNKIATIGENISLRRVSSLTGDNVYSYVHNSVSNDCGKIGVLVSLEGKKDDDFGKKLAMHIAATAPLAMSEKDIAEDIVNREKKIISEQLLSEGKPADIAEKILSGKLKKFYQENTLLNQKFVMDPDSSIKQVLENNKQTLISFARFKVGEGIDKKESDFATEVKDIVS
ncbi:MAG: translation elongation factor Ts [Rhodobacterales bacterium TMED271]|nr:MAG: translation elongation factor Ts [Rhodobacterales bacterium TMED271]RCL75326.1 MAG: elongation factor Ts [Alphaproteobacteria bacterium]